MIRCRQLTLQQETTFHTSTVDCQLELEVLEADTGTMRDCLTRSSKVRAWCEEQAERDGERLEAVLLGHRFKLSKALSQVGDPNAELHTLWHRVALPRRWDGTCGTQSSCESLNVLV